MQFLGIGLRLDDGDDGDDGEDDDVKCEMGISFCCVVPKFKSRSLSL